MNGLSNPSLVRRSSLLGALSIIRKPYRPTEDPRVSNYAVSLSAELESDVQWSLMIDCLQHLEPEFTIYIKTYLGIKTIWAKRWASGVLEEFWMVDFELAPLNRLKELTRCERKEKNNNRCQIILNGSRL